jgi:hypothetical protein
VLGYVRSAAALRWSFEEAPFGWVGGQVDGAVVGGGRATPSSTGEEIGARGVVRLVVLEQCHVDRVEGVETSGGATLSPMATARLSAVTALGRVAWSWS